MTHRPPTYRYEKRLPLPWQIAKRKEIKKSSITLSTFIEPQPQKNAKAMLFRVTCRQFLYRSYGESAVIMGPDKSVQIRKRNFNYSCYCNSIYNSYKVTQRWRAKLNAYRTSGESPKVLGTGTWEFQLMWGFFLNILFSFFNNNKRHIRHWAIKKIKRNFSGK